MKSFAKFYFQKLDLLGKSTTPLSDFWVLAGSFLPKKTPTLPLPRVHCLGESFLLGPLMEGILRVHQRLLFS